MGAGSPPARGRLSDDAALSRLQRRHATWDFERGTGWVAAHRTDAEITRHALSDNVRMLKILLGRIEAEQTPY